MTREKESIVLKYIEQFETELGWMSIYASRMSKMLGPREYDHEICMNALVQVREGRNKRSIIENMDKKLKEKRRF
jgi:hypothetical protein